MAIRVFVYSLLALSLLAIVLGSETKSKEGELQERAALTFHDSTLYVIAQDGVESIVNSKKVLRYKNRDVMYDGRLITKVKNQVNLVDTVESKIILKVGDDLTFLNDVYYSRGDSINLKTDALDYNTKLKIAKNSKPFEGIYYGSSLKGKNLYMDLNKSIIRAKNAHFKINMN